MAISSIEYNFLKSLREQGILPESPHILEFGESNWYGDVSIDQLRDDIVNSVRTDTNDLLVILEEAVNSIKYQNNIVGLFNLAKVFWLVFTNFQSYTAIDMGGPNAHHFDLNYPVIMDQQFDIVINIGTAEHIFNVCQFFCTIHELTKPGGLMIHALPFTGWIDHGFYNFQPTFIWDLAAQLNYQVICLTYAEHNPLQFTNIFEREALLEIANSGKLGQNSMLLTVLQKRDDSDFAPPIQGYYNNTISDIAKKAWYNLR